MYVHNEHYQPVRLHTVPARLLLIRSMIVVANISISATCNATNGTSYKTIDTSTMDAIHQAKLLKDMEIQ